MSVRPVSVRERAGPTQFSNPVEPEPTPESASSLPAVEKNRTFDLKRVTRPRRIFSYIASASYLIALVFLVLVSTSCVSQPFCWKPRLNLHQVMMGSVANKPVLRDIYFFRLDVSNIIADSVPNAQLINSIAQSIGLHDFYQVGLWGFCEGYGQVVTSCSSPRALYWFDPVKVLTAELLAGASIPLPAGVSKGLEAWRVASHVMFGFFLSGAALCAVLACVSPVVQRSRWWAVPVTAVAFLAAFMVLTASVMGSVISLVFNEAMTTQSDLNIRANVGSAMFVFMWLATAFTIWAFSVHAGLGCCCVSTRDITTGRRDVRGGVLQAR